MKKHITTTFTLLVLFSFSLFSQTHLESELSKNFANYSLQDFDSKTLYDKINSDTRSFHDITLKIGEETFELELWDSGLRSEDYILTLADGTESESSAPLPLKGYVNGDFSSNVRLTINDGFLYGYIKYNDQRLNIQPAWYFDKSLDKNKIVSYYDKAIIIPDEEATCTLHKHEDYLEDNLGIDPPAEGTAVAGLCYDVEIALAADWLMYDEYGSTSATENQMTGVLNDVQGNYDDEFADELIYVHTESWISNCNTCDPWTNSTDAGTLLSSFTNWGGFTAPHDVGTLWTDRDFDGSTVGIAWVGVICTGSRYNCCQDYTNSSWSLRVMMAHELGHNWDCLHDSGGGFIMSPSVNNTSTWSSASISDLENHLSSRWCLDACQNGTPPVADFDFVIIEECVTGEVEFFDASTGASSWLWTFPGGNPSSSTDQNPVVFYNNAGSFTATLEASNASGTDVFTSSTPIEIEEIPLAEFTHLNAGLTVSFFDFGLAGTSPIYFWDFGDGMTSTQVDPIHDYAAPGVYTVTLEVQNNCGLDVYADVIEVYDTPVAGFFGNPVSGCVGDTVDFVDQSYGNIVSWNWTFEGGTPSTSTDENPSVIYSSAGVFDVNLEVTNPEGISFSLETDYVGIGDLPLAGFGYAVNGADVTFTNSSSDATSYSWDFGDGSSDTAPDPMHTYGASGNYQVILTSTNPCGMDMDTQTVVISLEPIAQFTTAQATSGCAAYTIDFMDTSLGTPTSWNWTFPGGSPATSTQQNPAVTYSSKGVYDVTLEVTNASGTDEIAMNDLVNIDDVPTLSASYVNNVLVVNFSSSYSNASSVSWLFGDGNSSGMDNPVHTYASAGTYNASVSATNSCGTTTENLTVTVSALPTPGISSNVTSGCSPLTVNYTDNSSSNTTSWNWTFPGGNPATSTDQNPVVTYSNAGSYDVTLEVSNSAGGNTQTWSNYVTVNSAPTINYDVSVVGNVVNLENLTPGTSANWSVSDGSSFTTQNVSHTLASNGTYEITLEVSNDCGTDMATFDIEIDAYPTSSFGYSQNSGCLPHSVTFEDNSSNATSYLWNFPGGTPSTSTDANPTVVYNSEGSFDVNLTVSNQYGSESYMDMDAIVVSGTPFVNFNSNITGSSVSFDNFSTGGDIYAWDFGDGGTSDLRNPTHSYVNPGTYEVILVVTNDCGSTTLMQTIVVDFSTPGISASFSTSSGCAPLEVQVTDNSSNDPTSWFWEFPGGDPSSSTDQNPKVTYNTAGVYSIMATIANADGSSTFEFTDAVTVSDVPIADFEISEMDGVITLTNNSVGATSYSWDFGDTTTSLDEEPTHEYTSSGTYNVTLYATNECGTVEVTKTVVIEISSIEDLAVFGSWKLSPNPSTGLVYVNFDQSLTENINFMVIDVLGVKSDGGIISAGAKKIEINIESKGTYFIVLEKNGNRAIKKLIVI